MLRCGCMTVMNCSTHNRKIFENSIARSSRSSIICSNDTIHVQLFKSAAQAMRVDMDQNVKVHVRILDPRRNHDHDPMSTTVLHPTKLPDSSKNAAISNCIGGTSFRVS